MTIINVAERNDVPFVDIAGSLGSGIAAAGISRAGRSTTGIGSWFQGTYGAILLNADGTYTYRLDNLDPDTNVLGAGQTGEDRFSYTYVENGALKTGVLTVRVGGVDEAGQQTTQASSTILYSSDTVIDAAHRIVSTAQYAVHIAGTESDFTNFTNNGSIVAGSAAADDAVGLGTWNAFAAATNNGRIEGVTGRDGQQAVGVNHVGEFVNHGVVAAYSSAFDPGGVSYLRRAVGLLAGDRIVNSGTIEAVSAHGEAFGIWTARIGSQILNSGYIYASGGAGEVTAIHAGQSWQVRYENSGTIHAVTADPSVRSVGISLFRDSTNAHSYGTLINSGTIVADVAIRAYAGYYTGIHVINSGRIEGALDFDLGLNMVANLAGGSWLGNLVFGLDHDVLRNAGSVTGDVQLGAGADLFDGRGGTVSGVVDGGAGLDLLTGGGGVDRLAGGADPDRIEGGGGGDLLAGGGGGDLFAYSDWSDSTAGSPDFISDFQSGTDKLDFRGLGPVTLAFIPDGGTTLVQASGSGGTLTVRVSGAAGAGDVITGSLPAEQDGGAGADILTAGAGHAVLRGAGGDDLLLGGGGNDRLDGGTGADVLFGRGGDDSYWIDHGGDRAIELDGEGTDIVYTHVDFSLQAFIENITLLGSDGIGAGGNMLDNVITGNSGSNGLVGYDGNDTLIGGGGADQMNGGKGADTFVYRAVSDSVASAFDNLAQFESGIDKIDLRGLSPTSITWVEFSNYWSSSYWNTVTIETPGGTMTIRVSGQVTLADFLTAGGTHGTEGDDTLTASTGPAELYGLGGNDTLYGSAAADLLDGGAGNDRLLAGAGDDNLVGGEGNDILYFGAAYTGADRGDGGGGRDSIVLQGHYTLTFGETSLTGLESISLQSGANPTFGDTANNFYDFDITMADGNVPAGVQLIVNAQSLRAGEDFTFDGSAETNGKFLVYGGHGLDDLTGGAGVDVFFFEGQRWGAGDKVDGGAGRDALVISGGDGLTRIEFAADALTDIESISVNNHFATDPSQRPSYELILNNGNVAAGGTLIVNGSSLPGGQVVNIDGRGVHAGNLILFGGGGHDVLTGGDGGDVLFGGSGADALTGGAGADTFRYDSAADSTAGLPDLIGDFQSGTDKIDLSRIDANSGAAGDQAFTWIGGSAFTGAAGELRSYEADGYRWVAGDTNGDGAADLVIALTLGGAPLQPGDFLL